MRLDARKREILHLLEKTTKDCKHDCFKCVYRETDLNRCWYLMTTDKPNGRKGDTCKHFVDWNDYNEYRKKHLN